VTFNLVRLLVLLACAMIALPPARSSGQEPLRIPYGVTTSLQHLPVLVGKDSGLFAKYGLNVEPVHIRGASGRGLNHG
jgi:ABC-type nitrate/sulfonate/bicarbonate transport system substrate-binding protein